MYYLCHFIVNILNRLFFSYVYNIYFIFTKFNFKSSIERFFVAQ